VMRRGYRLGDQILRHALVGVVDTVDDEPLARTATEEETDADAQEDAESDSSSAG